MISRTILVQPSSIVSYSADTSSTQSVEVCNTIDIIAIQYIVNLLPNSAQKFSGKYL